MKLIQLEIYVIMNAANMCGNYKQHVSFVHIIQI